MQLRPHIQRVFDANGQVWGDRRVWRKLRRKGFHLARCTMARLMKIMDIQGIIASGATGPPGFQLDGF